MAGHQNKLSRFWHELKRRKVINVVTVYASAAFVIIELIGNLTEPLNLPASLSTIVIIVLAVGFPLAIILSWLYDLTSGSFERTRPMEDIQEEEKAKVPNAWKIATYVSFLVIAGLVVFNIVSRGDVLKPGMIQSLAILPFENYTGDEQLDYVAAGMHTALIGDMGKLGALRVIGKTSSSTYKNTDKSAPDIGKELDVQALVEPAVMYYGDSIILQIKVITLYPEEKQLFVEDYMVDNSQVLHLFSKISRQIADEIMIELSPEEERLFAKSRTVDREAYDDYLRSYQYVGDLSQESLNKGLKYLNLAVEKDPNFAPLYAGLAQIWVGFAQLGYESPEIAGPKIFEYLNKALELDPDLPDAHYILAVIAVWTEWNWEKGQQEFLKALAVNPNDALSRVFYGHLLMIQQRQEEALSQAQLAVELDPLDPLVLSLAAVVYNNAGDRKNALNYLDKALSIDPHHFFTINLVEQIAFQNGDYDKAFEAGKFMMTNDLLSSEKDAIKEIERIFSEQGFFAAYEAITKQMEIMAQNEYINPMEFAVRYSWLNHYEKAMDWIEKGFELRDQNMPYITTGIYKFDSLYDNPRFVDIVEKMNLPLPKTE